MNYICGFIIAACIILVNGHGIAINQVPLSYDANVMVRRPIQQPIPKMTFSTTDMDNQPICGINIQELPHATWAYTAKDGSVVTYTCNVGFRLASGETQFEFTCSPGKSFPKKIQEVCEPIRCVKPSPVNQSRLVWPFVAQSMLPILHYCAFSSSCSFQLHLLHLSAPVASPVSDPPPPPLAPLLEAASGEVVSVVISVVLSVVLVWLWP
jgi:hypothetical protein